MIVPSWGAGILYICLALACFPRIQCSCGAYQPCSERCHLFANPPHGEMIRTETTAPRSEQVLHCDSKLGFL